ncbi:hypothetical protein Q5752_000866 [Cryptotrichosporon argae]
MTTSASPLFATYSPHTQVVAHAALKTAQAAGMLVPPLYVAASLLRGRGFSARRLMRVSTGWVGGGAVLGAGMGWARLAGQTPESVVDRTERLRTNASQIRADDYSFIGAALGSLVAPAVFTGRARLFSLALGGASIGLGAGVWAHLARMYGDGEDARPEGMVGEIPVVGGNDKR